MRKIKPLEILIIIGIIVLSATFLLLTNIFSDKGSIAVITVNSEIVKEINLQKSENCIFNIKNMKIEVKDGKIRILSSDCPDKICMHKGFISNRSENIICIPNKLIIKIR